MKINWFPGHMTKALRMMEEEVKKVDVVIYVLDARAPLSCLNPSFSEVIGEKPILYVLNKCDLADERITEKVKKILITNKSDCIDLVSTISGAKAKVIKKIQTLCNSKIEKYRQKGIKINLRAMVIGVPNSGKSTLINNLCNVTKAITGNKPGVTKGKQWVSLGGGIEVLDTPGTLWSNLTDKNVAENLAFIGSIKDEVLDVTELSLELLKKLNKNYSSFLNDRYNIDFNIQDILGEIATKRKYLVRGGEPDYERTAKSILNDFRSGKIGRITLDEF